MKILCYIHSLEAGGAERVLTTLANDWVKAGHDVTIVTTTSQHADFYRLDAKVRRLPLPNARRSSTSGKGLVATIARIVGLRSMLAEHKPDIAVSMMNTANVVLALAGVGLRSLVRIGSERSYPPFANLGPHWRALRRFGYGLLHGVVVQTPESGDWLQRNTWVRRTWVIPNPIALPIPRGNPYRDARKRGPQRKRALAVGRLVPEKRFDLLIDVFGRLAEPCRDWDLVIIGEGPERPRIEHRIRELNLTERVNLTGTVGNVGDWYGTADLFVSCSRFEGFPNALLEALAHGVPAVATDCLTGPRALIRDGIDGLLTEPGDVDTLYRAMQRLMTDQELRARFAARAVEARERFSVERVTRMWIDAMEECA